MHDAVVHAADLGPLDLRMKRPDLGPDVRCRLADDLRRAHGGVEKHPVGVQILARPAARAVQGVACGLQRQNS